MQILEFFFQSFAHWIGGLVYLSVFFGVFGLAIGMIVEILRGK